MSLGKKIVKGSLWSFLGSSSYQLFGLAIFIILSRLLTPVDFGTAALAIVFVELTNTIVKYGLIEVVVRSPDGSNTENNVFYATLLIGIASTFIFIIFAPYLEVLFEAPGLAISIQLLSIVPVMQALTTVPEGLLRRSFKFKNLALRLLISSLFAGLVAICLAYTGYGFYSLIVQKVFSVFLSLLLTWKAVNWRPKFYIHFSGILSALKQGQPILLTSLIGQGIFRFVELIIGYFLGVAILGIYKIAGKLLDAIVQFTIRPVVDVSFSAFAKLKDSPAKLKGCYLNFITICALIAFPAFFGALVIGEEIVNITFGQQWEKSGIVFSILCLSGISASLNYFFSQYCHATGNSHIPFRIRIFEFFAVISLVSIFSQVSIYHVAYSNVAVSTFVSLIMLVTLRQKFSFSLAEVFGGLFPSFASSLFMTIVIYFGVKTQLYNLSPLVKVLISVIVGLVSYVMFYKVFYPKNVTQILVKLKKLRD